MVYCLRESHLGLLSALYPFHLGLLSAYLFYLGFAFKDLVFKVTSLAVAALLIALLHA